jgi:hypothetical protein
LSCFTLTLVLSHRERGSNLPPPPTAPPDVIASEANAERGNLHPPRPHEIASSPLAPRMYENAAVCQWGRVLKLYSAPFIRYSSLIARSRFTGCMYSPISGHEHLPGGVAINERAQSLSCEPRAYLLGDQNFSRCPRFMVRLTTLQHRVSSFC